MPLAAKHFLDSAATEVVTGAVRAVQVDTDSPRRDEAEEFIHSVFLRHHAARVSSFAPQLLLGETPGQVLAAAGWRVETIWECDLKDAAALKARLERMLSR